MSTCSKVPVLSDPPQNTAGGKYVVVVDENGESRRLVRRPNSIAGQWGDNFYLADGSDNAQIVLDSLTKKDYNVEHMGLLAQLSSGRVTSLFNSTAVEKIPVLVNGKLTLENRADSAIPSTGSGFVVRQPDGDAAEFVGDEGLWYIDGAGVVQRIVPREGGILKWINGAPAFNTTSVSSTSGTLGVTGIDDATCYTTGDKTVSISIPRISLTDNVDEIAVDGPISLTIDFALVDPDLLGLDVPLVGNKWYYLYVISDDAGSNVSAVASQADPSVGPDLSASAFSSPAQSPAYTRWGMVGICFYNTTGAAITKFYQRGRRFVTNRQLISRNVDSAVLNSWSYLTELKQNVRLLTWSIPPIAKAFSGLIGGSSNVGDPPASPANGLATVVASSYSGSLGMGEQYIGRSPADIPGDDFAYDAGSFTDLLVKDPTNGDAILAWKAAAADNHRVVVINGYTI